MDPMSQEDLNALVLQLRTDADMTALQQLVAAIQSGHVEVTTTTKSVCLRVPPPLARVNLGRRLRELRAASPNRASLEELAAELEISYSALIRCMHGQSLPRWVIVKALVQALGGKPEDYREAWRDARDDDI